MSIDKVKNMVCLLKCRLQVLLLYQLEVFVSLEIRLERCAGGVLL